MDYAQAVEKLYALERRGVKLELSRVRSALDALDSPDQKYPIIHVAGTNGKGSVCAMLSSCLGQAGKKTGLFTSPHLHRFTERIAIDGAPIDDALFVRSTQRVLALEEEMDLGLSFFECAFLIACVAFCEAACDWVVLETGLGGRLDATNTVTPVITVIAEIDLDHTRLLGDTVEAIAAEKAGIIKLGVPLICGASSTAARAVIEDKARESGADIWQLDHPTPPMFALKPDQPIGLRGEHQRTNAALSVATLRRLAHDGRLTINEHAIEQGLAQVRWPGRIEVLSGEPAWILDAAHNPAGCEALAAYLGTLNRKPRVLLFGAMADKNHAQMLAALQEHVDEIILTRPPIARAAETHEIDAPSDTRRIDDWKAALHWAEEQASPADQLIACGSIFLIAAVRAELLGLQSDPGIRM